MQVGVGSAPAFQNGWSNNSGVTGVGTPSPLMFYRLFDRVYIWGEITWTVPRTYSLPNLVIFTLPPGYLPLATEEVFKVPDITSLTPTGGYSGNPLMYNIWITGDGSVNFLGAPGTDTFSISMSGINFKVAPPVLEE